MDRFYTEVIQWFRWVSCTLQRQTK